MMPILKTTGLITSKIADFVALNCTLSARYIFVSMPISSKDFTIYDTSLYLKTNERKIIAFYFRFWSFPWQNIVSNRATI